MFRLRESPGHHGREAGWVCFVLPCDEFNERGEIFDTFSRMFRCGDWIGSAASAFVRSMLVTWAKMSTEVAQPAWPPVPLFYTRIGGRNFQGL